MFLRRKDKQDLAKVSLMLLCLLHGDRVFYSLRKVPNIIVHGSHRVSIILFVNECGGSERRRDPHGMCAV